MYEFVFVQFISMNVFFVCEFAMKWKFLYKLEQYIHMLNNI